MFNKLQSYLHIVFSVEFFYKAAQNAITTTNTKKCITEHIKSKHALDIMKSENTFLFLSLIIFLTTLGSTQPTAVYIMQLLKATLRSLIFEAPNPQ
jgi:hypothetical protein